MTRIAVVDDERELLNLITELFEERGWEVLPLAGGAGVVQAFRAEQPDVVLLDLWLGGSESGWQILQRMKMEPATRDIPVVVWTGALEGLKDKAEWLKEHSIPTLSKPFDIDELFNTIDGVLAGSEQGSHLETELHDPA